MHQFRYSDSLTKLDSLHKADRWQLTTSGPEIKAEKLRKKESPQVVGRMVYPMTYGMCGFLNHDPMIATALEMPEPNCQGVFGVDL